MLCISRSNIKLTRGDSATFIIGAKASNGDIYMFDTTDIVTMTCKETAKINNPLFLFQKTATIQQELDNNGDVISSVAIIDIVPDDTNQLNFDTYTYDIELRRGGSTEEVNTLLLGTFTVTAEVTF